VEELILMMESQCFQNKVMLVHSGKVKHSGLPISKGKRYVLVAFVNIIINMENDILEHMNKTAKITDRK